MEIQNLYGFMSKLSRDPIGDPVDTVLKEKGHLFLIITNLFQLLAFVENSSIKALVNEITATLNVQDIIVSYVRTISSDKAGALKT